MGKRIKELNNKNIKLNITAVYNTNKQKILASINKNQSNYIYICGRAADVGKDPVPEIKKSIKMQKNLKMLKIMGLKRAI